MLNHQGKPKSLYGETIRIRPLNFHCRPNMIDHNYQGLTSLCGDYVLDQLLLSYFLVIHFQTPKNQNDETNFVRSLNFHCPNMIDHNPHGLSSLYRDHLLDQQLFF